MPPYIVLENSPYDKEQAYAKKLVHQVNFA
jgi:hypothetical protein